MNEPISISRGSALPLARPVPNTTASGDAATPPVTAIPATAHATSDRPQLPTTPPRRYDSSDDSRTAAPQQGELLPLPATRPSIAPSTAAVTLNPEADDSATSATDQPSSAAAGQVDAAVTQINDYFGNVNRTIRFKVDDETGVTLINVVDTETDKVIRQVPPEEMLVIARRVSESDDEVKPGLLLSSAV